MHQSEPSLHLLLINIDGTPRTLTWQSCDLVAGTTYNTHGLSYYFVAHSIAYPLLKRSVVGSILLSGPSCSLGYFPFQPVVHNWFIKGCGMYCSVYGKVHIKDPLLLIEKSSLCGGSGFPSKKCVNVTI